MYSTIINHLPALLVVFFGEIIIPMKNEPVVTYNHMDEDDPNHDREMMSVKNEHVPISLYMLLVVDAVLISAIVYFTVKVIF